MISRVTANRWNAEIKHKIRDSRVYSAEHLVSAIKNAQSRPKVFVQGSAIGFYGYDRGDETLTEDSERGDGFLADVVSDWEEATAPAEQAGLRACTGPRLPSRTGTAFVPHCNLL